MTYIFASRITDSLSLRASDAATKSDYKYA